MVTIRDTGSRSVERKWRQASKDRRSSSNILSCSNVPIDESEQHERDAALKARAVLRWDSSGILHGLRQHDLQLFTMEKGGRG